MLQFGTCIIILRRIWVLLILGAILMFGIYLNITYFFYTKQTLTEFNNKEETPNPWGYSNDHILNINVRMIPSESMIHPDLYL